MFRRVLLIPVLVLGVLPLALPQEKKDSPPAAEPPLEKLVELNARELFGGETAFHDGGRVTLRFPGKGSFARGFRVGSTGGRGFITNLDDLKDPNMRGNVAGGVEGSFSFAGIESGEALSKFEMAEDFKISFRMKAAVIPPGAVFLLRVNQEDAKSYVQTAFFQDVNVLEGGKPRRKATTDAQFTGPPHKWFTQKNEEHQVTPLEIVFHEKKLSVSMSVYEKKDKFDKTEIVSQDGIDKPSSGRIFLKFSKLSFGISDFVIDGKYSRSWAETEIARLRKEKKLRLVPEDPAPLDQKLGKADVKNRANVKGKSADKKPRSGKPQPPDVNQPDPESEVDL